MGRPRFRPLWIFVDAGLCHPQERGFFRDYGRVIHDRAIYGVEPEGKLHVDWEFQTFSFPDGERYELAKPTYTITDWYKGEISPDDLFCTVRIPLRHVGMAR